MPTILLINDNKIVSRLLQLSSQKHHYALEEINDYTASEDAYNVIFIDSDKYDEEAFEALKATLKFDKLGFIGDKTHTKPEGFDLLLEKPFLPTDFVGLMDENFKVMDPDTLASTELDEIEEIEGEDELDLDNLEEMTIESEVDVDELEDLDDIEVSLDDDLEEISDTIAEPETMLTTGIATTMVQDESKEELADIVSEIDNMEESDKVLEEMDLDSLEEESTQDALVKESLEEVEEEIADASETLEATEEIAEEQSEEPTALEIEEVLEEEIDIATQTASEELSEEAEDVEKDAGAKDVAIAAGVAATVAAVSDVVASDKESEEEIEETLSILDGVESIESEDDYLKENEHVVQDLADEFDSLNEAEVEQIMSPAPLEEVISEEIEQGEEKVVEANDLEEMITRAVAKAITKEMLQEALNDMEISISLKTKKES